MRLRSATTQYGTPLVHGKKSSVAQFTGTRGSESPGFDLKFTNKRSASSMEPVQCFSACAGAHPGTTSRGH